jgi:hypothetical protein
VAALLREQRGGEIEALAAESRREVVVEVDSGLPEGGWAVEAVAQP